MKIIRFEAENFKRLKAVSITPHGNTIQITGANGSGKSSVLDAIYAALAGKGATPDVPVRQGEESARITLDLGTITVTRRFTAAGGTSLVVESQDGARFMSPQTMLDKMLGALTFDPLEFTRLDARAQKSALGKLVGLDAELKRLDASRRTHYDNRAVVNRSLAAARLRRADAGEYTLAMPVNVQSLLEERDAATKQAEAVRIEVVRRADDAERADRYDREAEELRARADEIEAEALALANQAVVLRRALRELPTLSILDIPNLAHIDAQIMLATTINESVERDNRLREMDREVAAVAAEADELTAAIDGIDQHKSELVAGAPMPVPELGFSDDGVTYRGVPFEQASSAEQLRVSVAIAMAANPQLRVLRVKDGSLLDEQSLQVLQEAVAREDFQLWLERVDTSGSIGVVMVDGEVQVDADELLPWEPGYVAPVVRDNPIGSDGIPTTDHREF